MKKIYAKSENDILLIDHSRNVNETSKLLIRKLPKLTNDLEWLEIIRISSLLHDIGKSTSVFQNLLKKNREYTSKNKFRHNEIGWAFCYRYLNVSNNILEPILYQIYWHHGISNNLNKHTIDQILETITEDDIETMKNVLVELLGAEYLLDEERQINSLTPLYYNKLDNDRMLGNMSEPKLMLTKIILIVSDHLQSAYETKTILSIDDEINKHIYKSKNYSTEKCPSNYDLIRHNNNIKIANDCDVTTIINGPGGLGKTDIGVHWNTQSDKRFMIVGPTNMISKSVYKNIERINLNYNLDLSIQLYLTGEMIETNIDNQVPFSSDINITNIDNFLKSQVDDKTDNHIGRLIMLLFSDVQFDEYHELLVESAMFRLFTIIMRMRHWYTESRTLLTSATPISLNHLWDTINKNTKILPEPHKHYNAPHDTKYLIKILNNSPTTTDLKSNNTLVVFNSISESQKCKKPLNVDFLIHSNYESDDKKRRIDFLYNTYGKESERTNNKPNVIGTPIVQTSLDISFTHLIESVCSPQTSLQRIPRVNRWGDINETTTLSFFNSDSKSEINMKNILYTYNLSNHWFEELKKLDGKQLTLNDINEIYNSFHVKYEKEIKSFVNSRYTDSSISLSEIYPVRFNNKRTNNKIIKAGGNKLRCTQNEIMVIVRKHNTNEYTDPTSQRYYTSIENDFNETGNIWKRIIGVYEELFNSCDERFDLYQTIKNKLTLDDFRRNGKFSNTPYVRFDQVYHPDYGFINETLLDNILKNN
jgi:CRISPR-associated endonuclease Cas3-HD